MAFAPRIYKSSLKLPVFDGGLNTKFTDTSMPLNQSPDLQNVSFEDQGAVATAKGYRKYTSTGIASANIDGLHSFYKSTGERTLLAVCNRDLYAEAAGVFVPVSGSTGVYSNNVDVKIETVKDFALLTDGTSVPHRYTGDGYYTVGVDAVASHTAAATAVSNGVLSGVYQYAITGVNENGQEGLYAIITDQSASATSNEIRLSSIPIYPASAGVETKYLYRNTAGASEVYYQVTALTAAQTSYVDNNPDGDLVILMPADNRPMPKCKFVSYYRGRVFAAGDITNPMRLYFSSINAPEEWPSTNFIDIGDGDGYPITGIRAYGNSIVIHKNDGRGQGSIWLVYVADSTGTGDPSNWYVTKSPSAYGGQSDKALAFFNNVLFFLNKNGGYSFTGQDIALNAAHSNVGSFGVDSQTYEIENDIQNIKNSYINKAAAINFDNLLYLAVPYGAQASGNNRIYLYDYVRASSESRETGAWSYLENVKANNFTIHEGELLFGSSGNDGHIYQFTNDYNYDGSAIDSYYWTAALSGQENHRDFTKVFRHVFLTVSTPGDWNMQLTYRVDFNESKDTTINVNLDGGGALWNSILWGVTPWGGSLEKRKVKIDLVGAVGKSIQFKFATNALNQYFKVHELELLYNLRSMR